MSDDFRKVSKAEFHEWVKAYPKKLEAHTITIGEPPVLTYNDFSDGKEYPNSIVARISMDWLGPDGEVDQVDHRRFWEYYVRGNDDGR